MAMPPTENPATHESLESLQVDWPCGKLSADRGNPLQTLRVQNLGCIKEAEIPLRKLNVFIGPNGTNKTWTAYALYRILKSYSHFDWVHARRWSHGARRNSQFANLKIAKDFSKWLRLVMDEAIREADQHSGSKQSEPDKESSAYPLSFRKSVPLREFADSAPDSITVDIDTAQIADALRLNAKSLDASYASLEIDITGWKRSARDAFLNIQIDFNGRHTNTERDMGLSIGSEGQGPRIIIPLDDDALGSFVGDGYLARELLRIFQSNPVAFPSERKALSTLYRVLSPRSRVFVSDDEDVKRIRHSIMPEPAWDFVQMFAAAADLRDLGEKTLFGEHGGSEVALLLEKGVLAGTISSEKEAPARFVFRRHIGNESNSSDAVDLHGASSLIRSLAGLDLYLRAFASPGDHLIIDEPEMNAHPEGQLQIAELVAILINAGFSVTLTTHSTYIVDHFVNLMSMHKVRDAETKRELAKKLKLRDHRAALNPEYVGVWMFSKDGAVSPILDREEAVVDWSTFSNETDWLSRFYSEILQADSESDRGGTGCD